MTEHQATTSSRAGRDVPAVRDDIREQGLHSSAVPGGRCVSRPFPTTRLAPQPSMASNRFSDTAWHHQNTELASPSQRANFTDLSCLNLSLKAYAMQTLFCSRGTSLTWVVACVVVVFGAVGAARAAVIELTPTDDALVLVAPSIGLTPNSSRRLENRGGQEFLEAYAGNLPGNIDATRSAIVFSFLRFDLSQVEDPMDSVSLRLETTQSINSGPVSFFRVTNDSWSEGSGASPLGQQNVAADPLTGITGSNFGDAFLSNLDRPNDLLATVDQPSVGSLTVPFASFDITPDIDDGFLTIAVVLDDAPSFRQIPGLIRFGSKESPTPPTLIVVPEPSTAWALAGAIWVLRKRRRLQ